MRSRVGLKLGLWLALLGIVSNSFTGFYIFMQSREMLTRSAEEKLLTATQVLARRINYSLEQVTYDVEFVSALSGAKRLADPKLETAKRPVEEQRMEEAFASMLASHADYFQIRLIDASTHGRELVRVDRGLNGIVAVRSGGLQEKGHLPYVHETPEPAAGQYYISRISINRETDGHQSMNKTALRIATPVHAQDGKTFGVIVVSLDLEKMFNRLRADIPDNISVFLTNSDGNYLIHPDGTRVFGSDNGRRYRIQDDLPHIAPMIERGESNLVLTMPETGIARESVAAFARVSLDASGDDRFMLVGLAMPLEVVLHDSHALGIQIIQIALVLSVVALIISLALSRILTQPLIEMARAISLFETGKRPNGLPVDRDDEIGYLAKSFQSMTARLNTQVGELQSRQVQLDYMAYHDPLTNLPNRVLFLDRLIQAINKAHRNNRQFAVMFIDLDKFKEVNDTLGHHIGDELLKSVAARMQSLIRQEDTISRLGGDEFTIILQDLHHADRYAVVAEKLLALFNDPFAVEGHRLELTCSIGISIYPLHGTLAEELLNRADAAMYQAKNEGRNNYQLFGG